AKGNIYHGALPRHPHCQSAHLVERDLLVVADAALGWATIDVVLHPVAGKDAHTAVVHADRKADGNLSLGLAQDGAHRLGEMEKLRGVVELLNGFLKRIEGRRHRSIRLRSMRRGSRWF